MEIFDLSDDFVIGLHLRTTIVVFDIGKACNKSIDRQDKPEYTDAGALR